MKRDEAIYPKTTATLEQDREARLAFYHFPAEHWVHRRTTRTKHCASRATFRGLAVKLAK